MSQDGDAVADGDGVENEGRAAGLLDLLLDELAHGVQVRVARHDVGVGIADGDEGLADIGVLQARGLEQTAMRASFGSGFDGVTSHNLLLSGLRRLGRTSSCEAHLWREGGPREHRSAQPTAAKVAAYSDGWEDAKVLKSWRGCRGCKG